MVLWIIGIIVLFAVGVTIFIKTAPQFGAIPSEERRTELNNSPNYDGTLFKNQVETNLDMGLGKVPGLLKEYIWNTTQKAPNSPLPVKWKQGSTTSNDTSAYLTWYGHSAMLLEMSGKKILIDPMLGPASSPVSFLTKRFPYQQAIPLEEVKDVDAVIISHDHYDHLDYFSITRIHTHVAHFYTPLAVGEHLKRWGVPAEKITELDWWESAELEGVKLTAAPARHFSGRRFGDRNFTQWASWIIQGSHQNVYFSGDGGYAKHFKEIGEKYGPFDFAMVECGQYNERWADIHMFPEETVQAGVDVGAKVIFPVHWGAFNLALHDWRDSILRAKAASEGKPVEVVHPYIGYRFEITQEQPQEPWWESDSP